MTVQVESLASIAPFLITGAPPASASQAALELGGGPFDGVSAGFFTGTAAGTAIGINTPTGNTADLIEAQVGGVERFRVLTSGRALTAGGFGFSFDTGTVNGPALSFTGNVLVAAGGTSGFAVRTQGSGVSLLTVSNAGAVSIPQGTLTTLGVSVTDANDIALGTTTGSKIGTGITQKLGFYNATPVAQRSGASEAAVATTGSTTTVPFGYTTAAQADAIVTLVNEIRATLVALGLFKGSA